MISFRLRTKWQNCRGYVPRYERTPKIGWFDIHSVFAIQVALDNGIRTIAFPSISTGIYHFPVELAAKIAVGTAARFLSVNEDKFDLVEWVLFNENTEKVYESEVDKLYSSLK